MDNNDIEVAVVGCGRWGKNLIRVFDDLATVRLCCHTGTPRNRQWLAKHYPTVECTTDFDRVLAADIDAVAIATPIETHYRLVRKAIENETDVFVEKPLTERGETARELANLALNHSAVLAVGYVFVHHPAFRYIAQVHADTPVEYARFEWRKLGGFKEDIIANLGSHDFAMAYRLFGSRPDSVELVESIQATGRRNIVTLNLTFEEAECQVCLNRFDPQKRKTVTFITNSDELYFWEDDTVRRFDPTTESFQPVFETDREPLRVEIERFLACVRRERTPVTDGDFGAVVTELFESL